MAGRKPTIGNQIPTESQKWAKETFDVLMEYATQESRKCNSILSAINTSLQDKKMRSTRISYVRQKGDAMTPEMIWMEENITFIKEKGKSVSVRQPQHIWLKKKKGSDGYDIPELLKGQPSWSHKYINHTEQQLTKIRSLIRQIKEHLAGRTKIDDEVKSLVGETDK